MTWRIGLLIPSSNTVMEVDFYRSLPRDATLHTSRMQLSDADLECKTWLMDGGLRPAVEALATARPHVVVFGCTRAALVRGREYDLRTCHQIEKASGATVISTAAAVTDALRNTHATSVTVVTPYPDPVNQRIQNGLEADGIRVSSLHGMGLADHEIAAVTPDTIYSFVQARVGPHIDGGGLFLAGTQWQAMSTLSLLKISYDVPVLTTNMAVLQAVKRAVDTLRDGAHAPGRVTS